MKKILVVLFSFIFLFSCTENKRARTFGGTENINITNGYKVVNCTWKDDDLWILTTKMNENEQPRILKFQETSAWGIFEGTIILKESK